MEDDGFIQQWEMSSFNEFITPQLAPEDSDLGRDLQQCLSSESYPSFYSVGCPSTLNCSSMEPFSMGSVERPAKINKSLSWNSSTAGDASSPTFLMFRNPDSPSGDIGGREVDPEGKKPVLISYASEWNRETLNRDLSKTVKTRARPTHALDHSIAERKRREKLSQRFIELSAIIPGLKKMDKASILSDAINYVKGLQERVKSLEEQNVKGIGFEPTVITATKKSQLIVDDIYSSSSDDNFDPRTISKHLPDLDVKLSEGTVLIRVHCKNRKGLVIKVLSEMEELHLTVTNISAMPFPGPSLHIALTAQMGEEYCMTVEDLAKKLNSAFC